MPKNDVFDLTCELIACESVTPDDGGCQDILAARLKVLGFCVEQINAHDTKNLWATKGSTGPHLMFAGHTDVVPTGPLDAWQSPPFTPTVKAGYLYGRGTADMKSSLAAMIVAIERLLQQHPDLHGTLSLLITSDEEGDATYGTQYAIEQLQERGIKPDYCIVGEPSSHQQLGDMVRCGRRGSLNAQLTIHGVQGHVAYPADVTNPIHLAAPALAELSQTEWDSGNEYYPPTSLQISNISAGTGATNVVPGHLTAQFNLRFNTEQTSLSLQKNVSDLFNKHNLEFDIEWRLSGEPFLTERGQLTAAVTAAIAENTGLTTQLSTSGGTSDGRFISPWCLPGSNQVEVIELGPCNATIHKIDERVALSELEPLANIYQSIASKLLL